MPCTLLVDDTDRVSQQCVIFLFVHTVLTHHSGAASFFVGGRVNFEEKYGPSRRNGMISHAFPRGATRRRWVCQYIKFPFKYDRCSKDLNAAYAHSCIITRVLISSKKLRMRLKEDPGPLLDVSFRSSLGCWNLLYPSSY